MAAVQQPQSHQPSLPDYPVKAAFISFISLLKDGKALALEAPTGSGKTTLLPILMLQAGISKRKILLTQPRRLAAKSVAERMSMLLGSPVGELVGYRVRGESKVTAKTRIEVVTEGYALGVMQADPFLSDYDWVILDEFHERHIEGDLLLAFLRDLRRSVGREEAPGTVVMTATWQGQPREELHEFDFHSVEGRLFPVERRFMPESSHENVKLDAEMQEHLLKALDKAVSETSGKVLVFLPGRRELDIARELISQRFPDTEISMLYGGLELAAQQRVLDYSGPGRQLILSTAVAETSLTIEGVTAVVDSGLERLPVFQPAQGVTRLVTRRLSRATSDQRAGRAGRLGPGVYYPLWSSSEDLELVERWEPEILTGDLSRARLQAAVWGGDGSGLPWVTTPPEGLWAGAGVLLEELGALDAEGRITERGRLLASLPLSPRLAHMIAAAPNREDAALAAAVISESFRFRRESSDNGAIFSQRLAAAGHGSIYESIRREAHDILAQIRRFAPDVPDGPPLSTAAMLSLAYPDRIGRRKAPGTYSLVTGAEIRCSGALGAEWVVFAELTGSAAHSGSASQGRQFGRLAEPLDFGEAAALHPGMLAIRREVTCTPGTGAFKVVRAQCFGKIVLKNLPADEPSPGDRLAAVAAAVRKHGFGVLPLSRRSEQLLDRLELARRTGITGLPSGDRTELVATLPDWLGPFLRDQLNPDAVFNALESRLAWEQKNRLSQLFPRQVELRPGQTKEVDYSNPEKPLIRGRMQEFYGINAPVFIAEGKITVSIELLSPAMRPLQTTADLGQFWKGSYSQIRSEMRGRYPKHYWPENPDSAEPSLATGKKRPE